MSIPWESLYTSNQCNNKLAGEKFEELVLEYLQSSYPAYTWKNTKSSWDDNHDFVILFLENIWAEAKYKKDCTALKKQDIDPTIMSGTLNGNIRLIFFVTNGYIPPTIMDRIKSASNVHGLDIVCITRTQLEYWLILHPQAYRDYFHQEVPLGSVAPSVALIQSIELYDLSSPNQMILSPQAELQKKQYYTMNVTVEANTFVRMYFSKDELPFQFVDAPQYQCVDSIEIPAGIHQIKLLIYTSRCCNNVLSLKYTICDNNDEKTNLCFPLDISIYPEQMPILVYDEQFFHTEETIRAFETHDSKSCIQWVVSGEHGSGKSFLLNNVFRHFTSKQPTAFFRFLPNSSSNKLRNNVLLCRLIIFINFGNIIKYFTIKDANNPFDEANTVEYYKDLLKSNFDPIGGDIQLILCAFEGCYDEIIAQEFIRSITTTPSRISDAIIQKCSPLPYIAILDDIQNLTVQQQRILQQILSYSKTTNNTCFLIAEESRSFQSNVTIHGLSLKDIELNLQNIFSWPHAFIHAVAKEMDTLPGLFAESILWLKQALDGVPPEQLLQQYIYQMDRIQFAFSNSNFSLEDLELLQFLYLFENGISIRLLTKLGVPRNRLYYDLRHYLHFVNSDMVQLSALLKETIRTQSEEYSIYKDNHYLKEVWNDPVKFKEFSELYDVFVKKVVNDGSEGENYILEKCRYFLYHGNYQQLYAWSKIGYQSVRNLPTNAFAERDFLICFHFGIALMHCERKRGAIEIFRWIVNNCDKDSNVYIMASGELYNSLYNRFELEGIDALISQTQMKIARKIAQIKDENTQEALDIRIAYSTCLNRAMMISFLKDEYGNARRIYEKYLVYSNALQTSVYSDKYRSMQGEWELDFARGMEWYSTEIATAHFKKSLSLISPHQNLKRHLLAQFNLSMLNVMSGAPLASEEPKMDDILQKLKKYELHNEYLRMYIGKRLCELVELFQGANLHDSEKVEYVVNEYKDDAFQIQLETKVYTTGRLAFQVRMYLSILEIFTGNQTLANKYLQQNLHLTAPAGPSYTEMVQHNIEHLNNISTLAWGKRGCKFTDNCYLIDPRIW